MVRFFLQLVVTMLLVRRSGQIALDWGLAFAAILLLTVAGLIALNPEARMLLTEISRR